MTNGDATEHLDSSILLEAAAELPFDDRFALLREYVERIGPESATAVALTHLASDDRVMWAGAIDLLTVVSVKDVTATPALIHAARRLLPSASSDVELQWSLAHAMAGLAEAEAGDVLMELRRSSDADVRWQVARGLPFVITGQGAALTALLELTRDTDSGVRDWATHGLANLTAVDSPAVRAALVERLRDESDAWAEALVGLAARAPELVRARISTELKAEDVGSEPIMAARISQDPAFLDDLRALRGSERTDEYELLDEAIAELIAIAGA